MNGCIEGVLTGQVLVILLLICPAKLLWSWTANAVEGAEDDFGGVDGVGEGRKGVLIAHRDRRVSLEIKMSEILTKALLVAALSLS